MHYPLVTVFGGSGFLGQAVIARLARAGYTVRVATRNPAACYELRTLGTPGQVVPQFYHPGRPETIAAAINGAVAVVNCAGILYERRRSTFHAAHVELPRQIATACKRYNVARFVHLSSLSAETGRSKYARSKLQGEQTVQDIFPGVTILRPSVIFGAGDRFFNLFAWLASLVPFLPLIGGGHSKFQPVYVGDVAAAVERAVVGGPEYTGQIYELGGPETLSLRQIYDRIEYHTGINATYLPLPWWMARCDAWFLQFLPKPILTPDQVKSLETDTVVAPQAKTFQDLGLMATSLDTVLPTYLARFRRGGKFAEMKRA